MQAQDLESVIRANVEGVKTLIVNDVSGGCGQVSVGWGRKQCNEESPSIDS